MAEETNNQEETQEEIQEVPAEQFDRPGQIAIANLGDETDDVLTLNIYDRVTAQHSEPVVLERGDVHTFDCSDVTVRIRPEEKTGDGERVGQPELRIDEAGETLYSKSAVDDLVAHAKDEGAKEAKAEITDLKKKLAEAEKAGKKIEKLEKKVSDLEGKLKAAKKSEKDPPPAAEGDK